MTVSNPKIPKKGAASAVNGAMAREVARTVMREQRKRIVILGGGFAGVYTALHLEQALKRRDDFEILLINKENYFVFQPMLAEVVSGSVGILDTVSPIRRMLPRTDLHVRDIESIDTRNQTVTTT